MATSIHQLGAEVYKLGLRLHKGDVDAVVNYTVPEDERAPGYLPMEPRKTLFSHMWYLDDDVYPDGVADIVGYWTEDRILGGVVAFKRETPAGEPQNAYWLSDRKGVTYRFCRLLDAQQDALIAFLVSDAEQTLPPACPLPVLGTADNRVRVSAEIAIMEHRIYRDEWERKAISDEELRFWQGRPQSGLDYPWAEEFIFRVNAQLGIAPPEGSPLAERWDKVAKPTQPRPRSPSPDVPPGFEIPTMTPPGPRTPSPEGPEGSEEPTDKDAKEERGVLEGELD